MGRGVFGPVASVTSVVSGGIPIVVGLLLGERPPTTVLVGVLVAVIAIWLIAGERSKPGEHDNPRSAMFLAAGAGIFFGGYFVLLSRSSGESGLWTLVAGRVAASVALVLTILVLGYGKAHAMGMPPRGALRHAAIAGVLDASANALYFYASRNGLLSVVAVVASMYPASTILLARVALREHVNRRRMVGMVAGLFAVSVIARGGAGEVTPEPPVVHANAPEPTPSSDSGDHPDPSNLASQSPSELAFEAPADDFFTDPVPLERVTPEPEDDFFAEPVSLEPATSEDDFFAEPVSLEPVTPEHSG